LLRPWPSRRRYAAGVSTAACFSAGPRTRALSSLRIRRNTLGNCASDSALRLALRKPRAWTGNESGAGAASSQPPRRREGAAPVRSWSPGRQAGQGASYLPEKIEGLGRPA
jgi:hypothetical protein